MSNPTDAPPPTAIPNPNQPKCGRCGNGFIRGIDNGMFRVPSNPVPVIVVCAPCAAAITDFINRPTTP